MLSRKTALVSVAAVLASAAVACANVIVPIHVDGGDGSLFKDVRATARAGELSNTLDNSAVTFGDVTVFAPAYAPGDIYTPSSSQSLNMVASGFKVGALSSGEAHILSEGSYDAHDSANTHSYYGRVRVSDDMTLIIGSSEDLPVGTPLTLEIASAITYLSGNMWNDSTLDWSLDIGGITIDRAHPTGTLSVTAGQTLTDVTWNFYAETLNAATADEMGSVHVQLDMDLVPEPASMLLLSTGAVGFLALVRRRATA